MAEGPHRLLSMLELHGRKLEISRDGVQTLRVTYYVDTMEGVDDVPGSATGSGGNRLDLVNISSVQAEEGEQHVVTATYEGMAKKGLVNKLYSWQPSESMDAIETNLNFWEIVKKYSGYEQEPGSGDFNMWPDIKAKKGSTKNPMIGVDSFLNLGGEWSETEVVEEISSDVWSEMWTIVDSVPGELPTPPNRYWLVLPPAIDQRGACFALTRRWRLTGEMDDAKLELARMIYKPVK